MPVTAPVAAPATPAATPPGVDADGVARALCGTIASIGRADFGAAVLAQIDACVAAGWWSVYRLFDGGAPPELHVTASRGGLPDGTMRSWRAYRASLYRWDGSFDAARDRLAHATAPCPSALVHVHAGQMPSRQRAAIYSRHGLRERLSVATRPSGEGSLLALNLYRHESQSPFRDRDADVLGHLGPLILACVERHVALAEGSGPAAVLAPLDALADLTARERQVCERLLKGWTHAGIGADLGLSATTVKTYRDRAFERLGIHHRNELFALALASAS